MKRFHRLLFAAIAVTVGSGGMGSKSAQAQTPGTRCYMAFIHGSGDKFHDEDAFSSEAIARYWTPDGVLVSARLPRRELQRFARVLVAESSSHRETA